MRADVVAHDQALGIEDDIEVEGVSAHRTDKLASVGGHPSHRGHGLRNHGFLTAEARLDLGIRRLDLINRGLSLHQRRELGVESRDITPIEQRHIRSSLGHQCCRVQRCGRGIRPRLIDDHRCVGARGLGIRGGRLQ